MSKFQEKRRAALRALLRPALRFCLSNSLRLQEIIQEIKSVIVTLATEELKETGERLSTSRLSVMTGMTRREVTAILRTGAPLPASPNIITRLIGQWEQDARFCIKPGKPRVLSCIGRSSEFKQLVDSVSKDANYKSVLVELERLGLVRISEDEVELIQDIHFRIDPHKAEEIVFQNIEDLLNSAEENIFNPKEYKNLHLRTEYDNVFIEDIPAIRKWLLEQGALFHKNAREHLAQYDKDISTNLTKIGGGRVILCAFSFAVDKAKKTEN